METNNKFLIYIWVKIVSFQDIDIAVAPMKMTAEREEVIDFVAPYFEQTGILIGLKAFTFNFDN